MEILVQELVTVVAVKVVSSALDSGNATDLGSALNRLIEQNKCRIILDLRSVSYLAASGFAAIEHARKLAKNAGGDICLINPPNQAAEVSELFAQTGADLPEIYKNIHEAVAIFGEK